MDENYLGWSWCDSDTNEVSYTIGTSIAQNIQAGQLYFTYVSTANGDRSKPVFKVQGQVGYNFPNRGSNFPLTTWTSFGYGGGTHKLIIQSDGNYILNPYYSVGNSYYREQFVR